MIKTVGKVPLIILLCFFAFSTVINTSTVEAFSEQIIQKGATGDDVVELQSRLQYIGFYDGTIDGVYGWGTYWAVKKYQDEFGLEVDGLVGPKMKAMLEKSTDFDYEWVHRQFYEGRKFTHYGKTPKEIQSGPEGSRIPPLEQKRRQQKAQEKAQPTPPAPDEAPPAPGEAPPAPGEAPPAPGEAPPAPGEAPPAPGEAPPAPGEAPPTPGEAPPAPGEALPAPDEAPPAPGEAPPAPGEAPEEPVEEVPEEPVPEEEAVPEADPEDGPDVEEAMNVPEGFSDNDIQIMAQAVYGEARGEPYIGQVAVAAVIINRINSPTFPNTASGVIFEPRAFTAVADGQIYMDPDETARRAVIDAINGQDPSGNAMYYFNPDTATSGWIWTRPQIKKIGKHIFCK